jgi:hypothetical protein
LKTGQPIKAPTNKKAPIHEAFSVLTGPEASGDSVDCSSGRKGAIQAIDMPWVMEIMFTKKSYIKLHNTGNTTVKDIPVKMAHN